MTKKFSYNMLEQGNDRLLAISDLSILGKTFEEGELCLTVSKDFYHHKDCGEKKAVELIRNATIVNAVGRSIITLMIKEKMISRKSVLEINGIPHAQIVTIK